MGVLGGQRELKLANDARRSSAKFEERFHLFYKLDFFQNL